MKRLFLFVLLAFLTLHGCKKENPQYLNSEDSNPTFKSSLVFVYNGQVTDSSQINWNLDSLSVVVGLTGLDTVLVFGGDHALYQWAIINSAGQYIAETIENIEDAWYVADTMDEYNYFDAYGESLPEYEEYLEGFTPSSRGWTKLFEHRDYTGRTMDIFYPKNYVGSSFDNITTSIEYATVGGVLCDRTYWRGKKFWCWAPTYGHIPWLDWFNDKTTSIWIY